jgi:hypothetical protein
VAIESEGKAPKSNKTNPHHQLASHVNVLKRSPHTTQLCATCRVGCEGALSLLTSTEMETLQSAIRAEEQALRPLYGFLFEGSTRRSVSLVLSGASIWSRLHLIFFCGCVWLLCLSPDEIVLFVCFHQA